MSELILQKRQVASLGREGPRKLVGLAALYEVETTAMGVRERIARGAFEMTLSTDTEVLAFVDHDFSKLLGRRSVGTLRLSDTEEGLAFELDVPDTTLGRDVLTLTERGDMGGMSFGFLVPKGGERMENGVRILTEIDLREISVVSSWPAYEGTRVEARDRKLASAPQIKRLSSYQRWR